jgi:CRISPR-associated protein Cas1
MLGYGYTVLQSRVAHGLLLSGLSLYEGIIHAGYRNRPSLSFDLTEEFRQPIVDRAVITQIVRKQVSPDDFVYEEGGGFTDGTAKRAFLEALYSRLEQESMHQRGQMQFFDIISKQAKTACSGNSER